MMYQFPSDSEDEDEHLQRYSKNTDSANYSSSDKFHSEDEDLSQEGYKIHPSSGYLKPRNWKYVGCDSYWDADYEEKITEYIYVDMNMTDNYEYWRKIYSPKEYKSYEKNSTITDNSSECSHSDLSQERYTSSVEIGNDKEIEDDKHVIFTFYKTLSLKVMKKLSVRYLDVISSVQHLVSNYDQVSYGILPTEIDYKKKSHCVGYLHRYAACHAALVFDAVSDIYNSLSADVLTSKFHKKSLNVMFLGGGPGNDFVGFLTALYGHHHHLFDLDVTVVDKMSGWKDVFNETVENLRRGDGGKAGSVFEEVNVTTTFISADLKNSEKWNGSIHAKLHNADIVFFVKALSHIPDGDKLQVLQNVVTCMKQESSLIYIDYPYPYRVFVSLGNRLRTLYQAWEMRYVLGHKDQAFGCSNIVSCRAVVKEFARL